MERIDPRIDGGRAFDWGRASEDYAKYRDIYPPEFYQIALDTGLCGEGRAVLDLGTGTGVLPRHLCRYGARWTGLDVSPEQIAQAKRLSQGMGIDYLAVPAEQAAFEPKSFDLVTACQCFWYFDLGTLLPKLCAVLKDGGKLLILYMAWLPYEDRIAGKSEALVLKYNPQWSGAGEVIHPIPLPEALLERFAPEKHGEFGLSLPFTRESWHGRMKACRGVGASLSPAALTAWEKEHLAMLQKEAPEEFSVRHYAAYALLTKK